MKKDKKKSKDGYLAYIIPIIIVCMVISVGALITIPMIQTSEMQEKSAILIEAKLTDTRLYLFFDTGDYLTFDTRIVDTYSECLPYVDKDVTVYYTSELVGKFFDSIKENK